MDTMYFQPIMPECIQMAEDLELPQFFIKNTSVIDCSQNYTTGSLFTEINLSTFLSTETSCKCYPMINVVNNKLPYSQTPVKRDEML